jgi:hypothetical protein
MMTSRLDDMFNSGTHIFFLKLDAEGSEEQVLKGFQSHLKSGRVQHLVIEVRRPQSFLIAWLNELGFACSKYDREPLSQASLLADIGSLFGDDYIDVYCKWTRGGESEESGKLLVEDWDVRTTTGGG